MLICHSKILSHSSQVAPSGSDPEAGLFLASGRLELADPIAKLE